MSRTTIFRLALLGGIGLTLAGCGGGGGGSAAVTPPPPALTLQQMFGAQFAVDFAASANSQPVVPMAGDIIALSLTTQPIPLH